MTVLSSTIFRVFQLTFFPVPFLDCTCVFATFHTRKNLAFSQSFKRFPSFNKEIPIKLREARVLGVLPQQQRFQSGQDIFFSIHKVVRVAVHSLSPTTRMSRRERLRNCQKPRREETSACMAQRVVSGVKRERWIGLWFENKVGRE